MIFNLFRYFSLRYLIQHPFRTFLTFLGVALGISLFLSINLINDATKRSLNENIENMTGKADLTVTSDGVGFDSSIADKIRSVDDVKNAVPVIINHAYLRNEKDPSQLTTMVFLGIDLLKDSAVREYNSNDEEIIPDPLAFLNQPDSIIVTKSWAARNSVGMDDSVKLLTKEGVKEFVIRGLVEDTGPAKAFNGNMVIMDIDGAMYNFGRENLVDRVDVILWGDRDQEVVKADLKNLLGPRFKVEDKREQSISMQQLVQSIQDVSAILGLVAFVVGFLIIVNTVNTAITQRRKDIGSLRTFGAGTFHIIVLFAGEFLFLALCSSIFGSWLGVMIANASAAQVADGLNSSLLTNITNMNIDFSLTHFLYAVLLGLISSSLALVYPLTKALRIHPIEALKPQNLDFSLERKPKQLIVTGIAGFILFTLTVFVGLASENIVILQDKGLQPAILAAGMTSIVLMGPFLVIMILSFMHGLKLPFLLKFSLANLLKNPARTASTSIHLFLGFSLVILVSAINVSFKETILGWANKITSTPNVINVTSWGSVAGFQVQPLHESLEEKLLKLPKLNRSVPEPVIGIRIVPISIDSDRFIIKAFDDPGTSKYYNFIDPIKGNRKELGSNLFSKDEETVLVSEPMLGFLKKEVGEKFEMDTPSGKAFFKIGGIIRDFASPNGVLYFNRDVYKKHWRDSLVTIFSIHHEPGISSEDYLREISPGLHEKEHLQVELPSKIAEEVEKNLDNSMAMSDTTKWVALLIGTMGLLNSFLIGILQRFREIGCIRSIGMTKGQLLSMIIAESATLGVTGVLVSFLLTLPLAYLWINWTFSYLLGWKVEYYFTQSDFLLLFGIGLVVSIIAGIFPALKAARMKLRDTLEYE